MKHSRKILLIGLMIAALLAAVVPALAISPLEEFNQSFEGDKNGDNIPDKWNTKGDVLRVCDHPAINNSFGQCAMVFPPSGKGAALWQRLTLDPFVDWTVLSQEGANLNLGVYEAAAKGLDDYRAYFGVIAYHDDGTTKYVFYEEVQGGTYDMSVFIPYFLCGETWCAEFNQADIQDLIDEYSYGMMVFPGDGYLAVDWMTMNP